MRIENSVNNIVFASIRFAVQLLLKFAVRTVFISVLSVEYLGLDSLFSSILQVLSIAELGFGSAIIYSMYKPAANKDEEHVFALLAIYKKFYFIVGCVILGVGMALLPVLPHLMNGTPPEGVNIYVVFLFFLINTSLSYFFSYKRSLLYVNQRNDVESKISTIILVFSNVVQILLLVITKNYYVFLILMPIFTILENIFINYKINKMYAIRKSNYKIDKLSRKSLIKNASALVGHKIGSVVVFSTDNIIMSSVLGLAVVGLYSNYFLIISAITSVISMFRVAITGSIGNSIALESVDKNYKNFRDISFINFWIVGFCSICLITIFQSFIQIWLGEQFLLPIEVVLCIVINFFLQGTRGIVNVYRETTGTFWNDRFKPIVEALVNLVVSIILVNYLGLIGIIIGTIVSNVLVAIPIEAHVLFKHYFKKKVAGYFMLYGLYTCVIIAVCGLTMYICMIIPVLGWIKIIVNLSICIVLPNLFFYLLSFKSPPFRYLHHVIKKIFFKKHKI